MKREAVSSTKMKKLCRALGLQTYAAVGLLESLWHLTAREAPQGGIGKLSDEDIALAIDYDGDPAKLIAALVETRWLDEDPTHRLIVHDWHEHAENDVRIFLARKGWRFANGASPHPNRHLRIEGSTKRSRRRDRMLRAGGDVSAIVRSFVFQRDEYVCAICDAVEDLTIDHITPVSRGGTNAVSNLRTLCRPCNSRKRDHLEVSSGA